MNNQNQIGQALEFLTWRIASACSNIFTTRLPSFVDTSDFSSHGLSRLCSYGANQDSKKLLLSRHARD